MPNTSASRLDATIPRSAVAKSAILRSVRPEFRSAPLRSADASAEAGLRHIGSLIARPEGRAIIEQGDPATYVFRVIDGLLRAVLLLPDGRRYVVRFMWPGDFFGFEFGRRHIHTVEAIVGVKLMRYERARLDELMATHPQAGYQLLGQVNHELSSAQDHLLMLGRKTALERLTSFLLEMATHRTDPAQIMGKEARLPMSRADIADYLGLTMETVSRLMTRLRHRRVIALPTTDIVVLLNRAALVRLADCKVKALRP